MADIACSQVQTKTQNGPKFLAQNSSQRSEAPILEWSWRSQHLGCVIPVPTSLPFYSLQRFYLICTSGLSHAWNFLWISRHVPRENLGLCPWSPWWDSHQLRPCLLETSLSDLIRACTHLRPISLSNFSMCPGTFPPSVELAVSNRRQNQMINQLEASLSQN